MHPDHLHLLYRMRVAEAERYHRRREGLAYRPRPPGGMRNRAAGLLVRLAARLAREPAVVVSSSADPAR